MQNRKPRKNNEGRHQGNMIRRTHGEKHTSTLKFETASLMAWSGLSKDDLQCLNMRNKERRSRSRIGNRVFDLIQDVVFLVVRSNKELSFRITTDTYCRPTSYVPRSLHY